MGETKADLQAKIYRMNRVLRRYERYFQQSLGVTPGIRKKKRTKKGHYPFIPYSNASKVLDILITVKNYIANKSGKCLSFIDCGCGIGNIVLLAETLPGFNRVTGIEYDAATYKIADGLLEGGIIKGDITEFENYSAYDVLYYYTPISDPGKQQLFAEKLMNDMKVGAVVICVDDSNAINKDKRFKVVDGTDKRAFEKVKEV